MLKRSPEEVEADVVMEFIEAYTGALPWGKANGAKNLLDHLYTLHQLRDRDLFYDLSYAASARGVTARFKKMQCFGGE